MSTSRHSPLSYRITTTVLSICVAIVSIVTCVLLQGNFSQKQLFDAINYDVPSGRLALLQEARRPLWVIAHPDDESLFFGPTLSYLLGSNERTGHLLCLSNGHYDGLGDIRERELMHACKVWGISEDHCIVVHDEQLQDDPNAVWNATYVEETVDGYASAWNTDLIITFDSLGVSGHPNHYSIFYGLENYHTKKNIPVFAVASENNLFAKYTSLTSFAYTFIKKYLIRRSNTPILVLNSLKEYRQARAAFDTHVSQYIWFRTFFLWFSRYLWFVELI